MLLVYKDHLSCYLRKVREICENLNFAKTNMLEILIYLEFFVLKSVLYSENLESYISFSLKR